MRAVTYLERVLLVAAPVAFTVAHLAPATIAWVAFAVLIVVACAALALRFDAVVGMGVLLVPAAAVTRCGLPSPAPLVAGVAAYVVFDRFVRSPIRAEWVRRGRLDVRVLIGIVGVILVASTALITWSRVTHAELSAFRGQMPQNPALLVVGAIGFAVINAITEELCYRGAIQGGLERALSNRTAALLGQAVLFGAAHFYGAPSGWYGVALASIYGFMQGVMRIVTGGLLAAWVAHVFTDLTIIGLIVFS